MRSNGPPMRGGALFNKEESLISAIPDTRSMQQAAAVSADVATDASLDGRRMLEGQTSAGRVSARVSARVTAQTDVA